MGKGKLPVKPEEVVDELRTWGYNVCHEVDKGDGVDIVCHTDMAKERVDVLLPYDDDLVNIQIWHYESQGCYGDRKKRLYESINKTYANPSILHGGVSDTRVYNEIELFSRDIENRPVQRNVLLLIRNLKRQGML